MALPHKKEAAPWLVCIKRGHGTQCMLLRIFYHFFQDERLFAARIKKEA